VGAPAGAALPRRAGAAAARVGWQANGDAAAEVDTPAGGVRLDVIGDPARLGEIEIAVLG
jgi:hypothetical protein